MVTKIHPIKSHQGGGTMISAKPHPNKSRPEIIHQNKTITTKSHPKKKTIPNKIQTWITSSLQHQSCYGLCWLWLLLILFSLLFTSLSAANQLKVFSQ